MVALHRRPAEAADAQGDARGVPAPPPRSRHAAHGLRPAQGARARAHPRRPGGRAREHRRGHRAHQGVAVAGGSEGRADGAHVERRAPCRRCSSAPATSRRGPTASPRSSGLHGGGYRLSEAQAQAILDLRLHRLTGLEQDKIVAEYSELLDADPATSSESSRAPSALLQVIRAELDDDPRRSTATSAAPRSSQDQSDLTIEDLIDAAGRRRHAVARRLCEGAAGRRTTRRSGAAGAARRRRR